MWQEDEDEEVGGNEERCLVSTQSLGRSKRDNQGGGRLVATNDYLLRAVLIKK